ncbi:TetR/AcrR family transcriptional regulator [Erwinia sp. V71]|uniref:TetR/AcrR family transcriptional regulator n=1 Tax=Erwinia sp. V71 TaxID=3369424 RepID=UPI003F606888
MSKDYAVQQRRVVERKVHVIESIIALLHEKEISSVSMVDVAVRAEIPLSSLYNLFPSKNLLLEGLAQYYHERIQEELAIDQDRFFFSWQQLIEFIIERAAVYYNQHPPMMQLFLGAGFVSGVRRVDDMGNKSIAETVCRLLIERFPISSISDIKKRIEISFAVLDGIWRLSYVEHQRVNSEYLLEGSRAMLAYLRCYIPEFMDNNQQGQR